MVWECDVRIAEDLKELELQVESVWTGPTVSYSFFGEGCLSLFRKWLAAWQIEVKVGNSK
jgi:hypothetical protein